VRFPPPTLLIVHCVTERQARQVRAAIGDRLAEAGLELHPGKTKVAYCKDGRRRGSHEVISFTYRSPASPKEVSVPDIAHPRLCQPSSRSQALDLTIQPCG
jgi:hypothetical protein